MKAVSRKELLAHLMCIFHLALSLASKVIHCCARLIDFKARRDYCAHQVRLPSSHWLQDFPELVVSSLIPGVPLEHVLIKNVPVVENSWFSW